MSNTDAKSADNPGEPLRPFAIIFLVAVCVWMIFSLLPYLFHWFGFSDVPENVGATAAFPESFFSGLAFAGVVYAILLQRRDLELQREEMRLARREAGRSADAQQQQVELAKKSALLQSLLAMSEFHTNQMELQSDPRAKEAYRRVANSCLDRARQVLGELGEPIEPITISSRNLDAANGLQAILDNMHGQSRNLEGYLHTREPLSVFGVVSDDLKKWLREYQHQCDAGEISVVVNALNANSISGSISELPEPVRQDFAEDMQHRKNIVENLLPIVMRRLRGEQGQNVDSK